MTPVDLLAVVFATVAVLEAWFHEDSFLAGARARTQEWRSDFFRTLLNCRLCLSYHVPWVLYAAFVLGAETIPDPYGRYWKLNLYFLAATGAVRLLDRLSERKEDEPELGTLPPGLPEPRREGEQDR